MVCYYYFFFSKKKKKNKSNKKFKFIVKNQRLDPLIMKILVTMNLLQLFKQLFKNFLLSFIF